MTRNLRTLASSLILAASLAFALPAMAGEAQNHVQGRRNEIAALMKDKPSAERDKKVSAIMSALFDFDVMAEKSLGKNWGDLNAEQQAEFKSILTKLIQRNIEKNVRNTANYDVEFLGEDAAGEGVVVKTKASSKSDQREEPIGIDYRLHKIDEGWRTTDVITEGSSMVNSYNHMFTSIIKKDGYPALIKKMKDKLAKESK